MKKKSIFVVDEEEDILEMVSHALKREGFYVVATKPENDVFAMVVPFKPDLIVVNFASPIKECLRLLKKLKKDHRTGHIPVVVLTTENHIDDEIMALENGADDFITKPFSPRVMSARIKAIFRGRQRERAADKGNTLVGNIEIDTKRRAAIVDGKVVELTYSEFEILLCLSRNVGWVLSRNDIIDSVHGDSYSVADRSVDVQIYGLRRKLGPYGRRIETVRGVGYRLNI